MSRLGNQDVNTILELVLQRVAHSNVRNIPPKGSELTSALVKKLKPIMFFCWQK